MIRVNMHEAKTRLSELVRAVEERNETIVLCRDDAKWPKSGAVSNGARHAISGPSLVFEWS